MAGPDQKKADYFGTFLDAVSAPNAPAQVAPFPQTPVQPDRDVTDQVIKALKSGPRGVKDLVPFSNNSLGVLLEVVGSLQSMGLVEIGPGNQYKLTTQGEELAELLG